MLRFSYDESEQPPAPYIELHISPHDPAKDTITMWAKLDSGASTTVLPTQLAQRWGILPVGYSRFLGYDGRVTIRPIYRIDVVIGARWFRDIRVTVSPRSNVLLGRDVMNKLRLVLDSPQRVVEVHGV